MFRDRRLLAAGAAVVAVGIALRVWAATFVFSGMDSDMAVLGLMARHVQDGEFSIFHWGQFYGGAQETYLAGLIGYVTGTNLLMLQVTTGILSFGVAVMIGLVARELGGRNAGLIAASLAWIWSAPFLWWSLKIGGNYWFAMLVALGAVLVLVRGSKGKATLRQWVLLGVLLGLAFWSNPQAGYLVLPAFLRYLPWVLRAWRFWIVGIASFGVAASPWIASNLRSGFKSLEGYGEYGFSVAATKSFVSTTLPAFFGLPSSWDRTWADGWVGVGVAVLFVIVLAVLLGRSDRRPVFALVSLVGCSVVFLYTPQAAWVIPRFYVWIFPWAVLRVAQLLSSARLPRFRTIGAAVLAVAALSTTLGLKDYSLANRGWLAPDTLLLRDTRDLYTLLDEQGVTRGFADYWLAYRITFETNERILVAPYYIDRHQAYIDQIVASGTPAHVFMKDSVTLPTFLNFCRTRNVNCPVYTRGAYAVVEPDQLITGEDFRKTMFASIGQHFD